jgi:hypothetical protein
MCNIKSLELLDFLPALQCSITLCNISTHGRAAVFAIARRGAAMELLGSPARTLILVVIEKRFGQDGRRSKEKRPAAGPPGVI